MERDGDEIDPEGAMVDDAGGPESSNAQNESRSQI